MPVKPFAVTMARMMLTVTLPGPLTALMPLLALRLTELSAMATLMAPEPAVPSDLTPPPLLLSTRTLLSTTFAAMPPLGLIDTPAALSRIAVSWATIWAVVALPVPGENVMPAAPNPWSTQFWMF